MKRLLPILGTFLLLLLLGILPARADYAIEVIQLKARPLEEILPLVQPLVGADGSASGMGDKLVLKAAPGRVMEIRKLLLEIDRPPKRLMITVNKQGDLQRSVSGYSASADIKAGDGQVSINSPRRNVDSTRARLQLYDTNDQQSRAIGQRVQALEGRPAFIASGSRIPIHSVERDYRYAHPYARRTTRLEDVSSGFYVVPRVHGEYVTLDIQQRDDRPGNRRGFINTQSTDTVVRGRLGEWISLGGLETSSHTGQGGLGRSISTQGAVNQLIEVMVECLDCAGSNGQSREYFPESPILDNRRSPEHR